MWIFITSLHHRRFIEDIANAAALPLGSRIRLRYSSKYCNPAVRGISASDDVLFVVGYRGQNDRPAFAPIRKIRVVSSQFSGSIWIFEIELLEFSFTNSAENLYEDIASARPLNLPGDFSMSSATGQASSAYFVTNANRDWPSCSVDKGIDHWERSVSGLFSAIHFFNRHSSTKYKVALNFFHCLEIASRPRFGQAIHNGALVVESGAELSLVLHQLVDPTFDGPIREPLGEVVIDVDNDGLALTTTRRLRVDCRRDARQLRFVGKPLFRSSLGHISLRSVRFDYENGARSERVQSRADMSLIVGRFIPYVAAALTAIAIAVVSAVKEKQSILSLDAEGIGTFIFVLSMAFIGLVMGFRKP